MIGLASRGARASAGMAVTVLERDDDRQRHLARGRRDARAGRRGGVRRGRRGACSSSGLRSAELWPAFAAELQAAAGTDVGFLRTGTLLLARDADEARELERQIAFRDSLGLATKRLRPSEAREREPALAPTVRLALEAPDDHSVDPRLVLAALRAACESAGVQLREHAPVARRGRVRRRVTGVTLGVGGAARAMDDRALTAASSWRPSSRGRGRAPGAAQIERRRRARVRCARSRARCCACAIPAGPGLLSRVVRFEGGYLVPRADGRYVLGATVEERGFDVQPDAGGVYELLRDAHELVPGRAAS